MSRMLSYAELAVTTNFSFLRGASHPGEFVERAWLLDYPAIGIADRNSLAGVVRAYDAWKMLEPQTRPRLLMGRGWSFVTARRTSSPIRKTAKPMAGSADLLSAWQIACNQRRMFSRFL